MASEIKTPGPGDDWGAVINTNFENLASDLNSLEDALFNPPGEALTDLKGIYSSLVERLSTVIENGDMLLDWRLARNSRLESTNTVSDRISKIEQATMVQRNATTLFSGAPDEVVRSLDQRSVGGMDDRFFIGGDIGRWGPHGDDAIADAGVTATPKREVYCAKDNIWAGLGNRWYQSPGGEYTIFLADGTWIAFYQTFDETNSAALQTKDMQYVIDDADADVSGASITINGISFTEDPLNPLVSPRIPRVDDVVYLKNGGGYYKVKAVIYANPKYTLTFYGKVDPIYQGAGQCFYISRPSQIPFISFHDGLSNSEILDMLTEPGRVMIGKVVIAGTGASAICTNAIEYCNLSRYKYLEIAAWGTDVVKTVSFEGMLGYFKNIVPVVITADEVIYPVEFGCGWDADVVYVRRYGSPLVCISPKHGTDVTSDASGIPVVSWGVIVEI